MLSWIRDQRTNSRETKDQVKVVKQGMLRISAGILVDI